tara:strand:+ start:241 stop:501 length:261 start_codon:yes stop_codon:yes gene_type:complete
MINNPAICIPRLPEKNTTKELIKNTFIKYQLGLIDKIDIFNNKAFIYFKYWNKDARAQSIKNRMLNGETLNFIYNTPWFWKCSIKK